MHRLLTQMCMLCSYYPLFPPPLGTCLDSSLGAALELPCSPDIMLLPSDLNPFAKVVPLPQHNSMASTSTAADTSGAAQTGVQQDNAIAAGNANAGDGNNSAGRVLVINPGRLAKGATGGVFAHLWVNPLQEALAVLDGQPPASNGRLQHHVDQRCKVEIRRI